MTPPPGHNPGVTFLGFSGGLLALVVAALIAEPSGFYLEAETDATNIMTVGAHVYRWTPKRVLAELDAKRQILDVHQPDDVLDQPHCITCGDWPTVPWPCRTVRLLALPYADKPGYREEWRP
jgi:hypothetical protein